MSESTQTTQTTQTEFADEVVTKTLVQDVALPGSKGPKLAFLMYPQCENDAGRYDALDPDAFKYAISAKELTT